jgi:WD40 repeat protein
MTPKNTNPSYRVYIDTYHYKESTPSDSSSRKLFVRILLRLAVLASLTLGMYVIWWGGCILARPVPSIAAVSSEKNYTSELKIIEVRSFSGHLGCVNSVAFSPDGREGLSASSDNTARAWDIQTGDLVRRFVGHTGSVTSACFSPDGCFVLTGSADETVRLWRVADGSEVRRITGHRNLVTSVCSQRMGFGQ